MAILHPIAKIGERAPGIEAWTVGEGTDGEEYYSDIFPPVLEEQAVTLLGGDYRTNNTLPVVSPLASTVNLLLNDQKSLESSETMTSAVVVDYEQPDWMKVQIRANKLLLQLATNIGQAHLNLLAKGLSNDEAVDVLRQYIDVQDEAASGRYRAQLHDAQLELALLDRNTNDEELTESITQPESIGNDELQALLGQKKRPATIQEITQRWDIQKAKGRLTHLRFEWLAAQTLVGILAVDSNHEVRPGRDEHEPGAA